MVETKQSNQNYVWEYTKRENGKKESKKIQYFFLKKKKTKNSNK